MHSLGIILFQWLCPKNGIAGALQHNVLFICREYNESVTRYCECLQMGDKDSTRGLIGNSNPFSVMNTENTDLAKLLMSSELTWFQISTMNLDIALQFMPNHVLTCHLYIKLNKFETKIYDLASKCFPIVASCLLSKKLIFEPCYHVWSSVLMVSLKGDDKCATFTLILSSTYMSYFNCCEEINCALWLNSV